MNKILGLDLGTNSIGWAVVDKENKTIDSGSRIFPMGVVEKTLGTGDKEESKNATRRKNRQTRRGIYRHRLRRIKLLEALIEFKMCPLSLEDLKQWKHYDKKKGQAGKLFPSTEEFRNWIKLNPYQLRAKALEENISLQELGRIYYHFIQRRGFLSSRKGTEEGAIYSGNDKMTGIEETQKKIQDTTLGNYLNSILPKGNEPFEEITDEEGNELRARGRYTLRDMYIAEFEKIWNIQAEQLGLNKLEKEVTHKRTISGSIYSNRNKKKIENLYKTKGKENVKINGNRLEVTERIPLKEYLGGNIYYDENKKLKHKSTESVLFYQRPLRSQKALLSKCSIEGREFFDKKNKRWRAVGPTPCPVSHPEFEEFRALQYINNIQYGAGKRLDDTQRATVLNLFNTKDSFKIDAIKKALKLNYETFNYADDTKVAGNKTISTLRKLFKADVWESNKEEIWHCFHFYEDVDLLIKKLNKDFGLKELKFEQARKVKLKDDYSSVSLKAIRNITPFLKKGYKYNDAVILGGVRNAFRTVVNGESVDRWDNFQTEHKKLEDDILKINHDKKNKEGEAIKRIQQYLIDNKYGFEENDKSFNRLYHHSQEIKQRELNDKLSEVENLRNPVVQQTLNELRRLVNLLLQKYGKFDEIKVELGRELKAGKQNRLEATYRNNENNKKNEEARSKLSEYSLRHTRENIQRYLLWKELEEKGGTASCPYTGKTIRISDVLGRNNTFQIEHIFPHSVSLDDGFGNKTLCESNFNRKKGNLTPYQFYQKNNDRKLWGGASSWEEIRDRAYKLLPYHKAKKFTAKGIDENKDRFVESQLNDTRYMSKKAKEILSEICKKDKIIPLAGGVTSELRHLWGLNNILQPVKLLDSDKQKVTNTKRQKHWVVFNKKEEIIDFVPKFNEKPELKNNQTTYSGKLDSKGQFTSFYFSGTQKYNDLKGKEFEGKYWKVLDLDENPSELVRIFTERPETNGDEIVLKGSVARKKFSNDNLEGNVVAQEDDGSYWAKFKIKKKQFIEAKPKEQPKKKKGQILLYGEINDAVFKSYIYECQTNEGEGKYWALIDLNTQDVEFSTTKNPRPETDDNTIRIRGTVNEVGIFSSDVDKEHFFNTNSPKGKYWAVFTIKKEYDELYPQTNPAPKLNKGEKLTEGDIWLDKYTNEIKFDPKKNRDDHRHHAIDAITIAMTDRNIINELSAYNAQKSDKKRGKDTKPDFPKPWDSFKTDVEKAAKGILISQKQNNRVLTRINKVIHKNGDKFISKGYAVAGQLHKESVFGKRKAPNDKEHFYHIRKSVESLTTEKQLQKIVDPVVRNIVIKARKQEENIKKEIAALVKQKKKANEAEEKHIETQISGKEKEIRMLYTLPNKNGERVPIKKVRIKETIGNATLLKGRKTFSEKQNEFVEFNQYVNPRNNHHVAIYENEKGDLVEEIVTLWETVERRKNNLPVIDKSKPRHKFVTSMQINDMFLLGLHEDELDWDNLDYILLNKHLYRVQKLSSSYYTFRHHLASTINNKEQGLNIQSFIAWEKYNPIKVNIDELGQITKA